ILLWARQTLQNRHLGIHEREVYIGDPVTLYCVFSERIYNRGNMFWFKQIIGQIPQVGASMQNFELKPKLYKEFNNSNLIVEKAGADGMYRLAITNTDPTDEAVYYCAVRTAYEANFINGTLLLWKGNHSHTTILWCRRQCLTQSIQETL
uniref:Ig-like domain-containing protein n=1 Tax=Hucho hucho TaxID=62062 RepID=A0A4W5NHU0_9TELE